MEQRRTRRFRLELPLSVTRAGTERVKLLGLTKNISSTGVLFTSPWASDLRGPIEYVITLHEMARNRSASAAWEKYFAPNAGSLMATPAAPLK